MLRILLWPFVCLFQSCLLSHLPSPFACQALQNHIPKKEIFLNIIPHYHQHEIEENQRNVAGLFEIIHDYSCAKDCPTSIFSSVFCPVKLWQTISIEVKHLQKIFQSSLRNTAILCTKYSRLHLGTSCWKDPSRRMVMERKFNSPPSFTEPRYLMCLTCSQELFAHRCFGGLLFFHTARKDLS